MQGTSTVASWVTLVEASAPDHVAAPCPGEAACGRAEPCGVSGLATAVAGVARASLTCGWTSCVAEIACGVVVMWSWCRVSSVVGAFVVAKWPCGVRWCCGIVVVWSVVAVGRLSVPRRQALWQFCVARPWAEHRRWRRRRSGPVRSLRVGQCCVFGALACVRSRRGVERRFRCGRCAAGWRASSVLASLSSVVAGCRVLPW